MRLDYIVFTFFCLSAAFLSCFGEEKSTDVPSEQKVAPVGSQSAPNNKDAPAADQNEQDMVPAAKSSGDSDTAGSLKASEINGRQNHQAIKNHAATNTNDVDAANSERVLDGESQVDKSESDQNQPQKTGPSAEEPGEQTPLDQKHPAVDQGDSDPSHLANGQGEEKVIPHALKKEVETPGSSQPDTSSPLFPHAVFPKVKISVPEGQQSEAGQGQPRVTASPLDVPTITTESSMPSPPVDEATDKQAADAETPPAPSSSQSELGDKEAAAEGVQSELGDLPLKPNDSAPLPVGSGGMAVDETAGVDGGEEGEGVKPLAEDFQTFDEWRKKVLEEEQEKENEKVKQMARDSGGGETPAVSAANSQKLRVNYASEKCGAKMVAYNPEMENGNHMLSSNKDLYMINPCSAKKWFVVELCEPIGVMTVELASLELFSSQPRSFRLSLADRYPTKEWLMAGSYQMAADKVPQSFSIAVKSPFVKYVRVELLDHYGKEHFCPITLLRVFGVPMEDDDGDDVQVHHHQAESEDEEGNGNSETFFARTKATVVNLMKKVLYAEEGEKQQKGLEEGPKDVPLHANFTGEHPLPCDPDVENNKLPTVIEGTPVTVHQPHPTVDAAESATQGSPASSSLPGEVPMVTKLDDGEQQEIEEKEGKSRSGTQDFVILLESGRSAGWNYAMRFCHTGRDLVSDRGCKYQPLCRYAEAVLGSPPLVSPPRTISMDRIPGPSKPDLESSPSPSVELEPSFTSSASSADIGPSWSSAERKRTSNDQAVVHPSLESSADGMLVLSSSQATSHLPGQKAPGSSAVEASQSHAMGGVDSESSPISAEDGKTPGVEPSSVVATLASAISASEKGKISMGTEGEMTETDQTTPSTSASGEAAGSSSDGTKTQTAAADSQTAQGGADSAKPAETQQSPSGEATEVLQPSINLDTTSVVSPGATRRTPVLEVGGASAGGPGGKGEVVQTSTPSLSPTPTSQSSQLESAVYPHIVEPTVEGSGPAMTSDTPDPVPDAATGPSLKGNDVEGKKEEAGAAAQNKMGVAGQQNETAEREAQLDLVRVPLSMNAKRETAIMRLTNRIKALELNVSLSSRFLEELSTRFKKQNEEMMRMMNKTMNKLNATATTSHRQVALHEVRIDRLETRLDNLTAIVDNLAEKFDLFSKEMSERQMIFTTLNLSLVVLALYLFYRSCQSKPLHPDVQFLLDTMPRRPPTKQRFPRRNSDLALSVHTSDIAVDAALKKGGSVTNIASASDSPGLWFDKQPEGGAKRKKRKKNKPSKAGSVDEGSLARTDSDPGLRKEGAGVTDRLGHRRCGSDTVGFPSDDGSFPMFSTPKSAAKTNGSGCKDVQFSVGGKPVPAGRPALAGWSSDPNDSVPPLSLPYAPSSVSYSGPTYCSSGTAGPTLPRNQRSKSLTNATDSVGGAGWEEGVDTFDGGGGGCVGGGGGGGGGGGWGVKWNVLASSTSTARVDNCNDCVGGNSPPTFGHASSRPRASPYASSCPRSSSSPSSPTWYSYSNSKSKKSGACPPHPAAVNGVKGGHSEHSSASHRKGSFSGGGSMENGRGGGGKEGGKGKAGKKSGRSPFLF